MIATIIQVFNGFGYIGSTIFALPGVEGLIPNYRNVDGSLNNVEWTCNSVIARTISGFGNYDYYLGFNGQGFSLIRDYLYNQDENINLTQSVSWPSTWVGNIRLNSDVITSFKPKTTFQAADYYDVPKLATDNTFTGVNTFNDTIYTNIRGVILSNEINDNQDIPPSEITDGAIFLNRSKTTSAGHDGVNSWIYGIRQLNGTNTVGMSTRKYINGVEKTSFVNCHVYPDGSAYAFCPTPPTTANGTEIATAAWVRQVLNARLDTNLSNISTTGKQNILMWGIPNYNAGVAKNKDVDYTAESCGYLLEFSDASASGESSKIIVNNVTVARIGFVGTVGGTMWSAAFVNKGDRYRFAGVTSTSRTFFPLRGGA